MYHERHGSANLALRDVVIGLSDGLTVPFALAAGVSAAVASSRIVVTAGLAEIVAGAISMGLGGYLASRTDADHYASEERREYHEVEHLTELERKETREIFEGFGLEGAALDSLVDAISSEPKRWVDFMMRFELGLDKPDERRAPRSAATIGLSYAVGGLVPLLPYIVFAKISTAFVASCIVTLIALLIFGAVKSKMTGVPWQRGALQTAAIGAIAAGVAYYLARLVGGA